MPLSISVVLQDLKDGVGFSLLRDWSPSSSASLSLSGYQIFRSMRPGSPSTREADSLQDSRQTRGRRSMDWTIPLSWPWSENTRSGSCEYSRCTNLSYFRLIFETSTLLFFCADMSAGSLSSFNPTILSQLGWTARRAQVMTIPIWIVGIVGGLSSSLISGRIGKRWPFLLPAICISVVGWTINYCQVQPANVRYFAQFCISFGTFVQMPLYIGMLTANLRGRAYQSMGSAILLGLGNCANFVSSNVFITTQSPTYPVGFGTGLALTAIAFPIMLFLMFVFAKHNKDLEKKIANNEVLDDQIHYKYVF